jgi:hypothetical protein
VKRADWECRRPISAQKLHVAHLHVTQPLKILLSPTFSVPPCICMHGVDVSIRLIDVRHGPQMLSACSRRSL